VQTGWDRWDLIGLFNYDLDEKTPEDKFPLIRQFELPLERFELDANAEYWAFEFWSGQFLGRSPFPRANPHSYRHPGDAQSLIASRRPGLWTVSFFGPAVKLLAVRRARAHPWVVGTSFHQSGGTELSRVVWDGTALRGDLRRPAGQRGDIVIAGAASLPAAAQFDGVPAKVRPGPNGSLLVSGATRTETTRWELRW
jgi:hypothetical protein